MASQVIECNQKFYYKAQLQRKGSCGYPLIKILLLKNIWSSYEIVHSENTFKFSFKKHFHTVVKPYFGFGLKMIAIATNDLLVYSCNQCCICIVKSSYWLQNRKSIFAPVFLPETYLFQIELSFDIVEFRHQWMWLTIKLCNQNWYMFPCSFWVCCTALFWTILVG